MWCFMYDDFSEKYLKEWDALLDECESELKVYDKENDSIFSITEDAIKRVPYIKFNGFTAEQCLEIQNLEKQVLIVSKFKNDCKEVALTYRLDGESFENESDRKAFAIGDENHVDIFSHKESRELFESSKELMIISMHNHPNNAPPSFNDILFFYTHDSIRLFIVVTNKGEVSSLLRNDLYLKREAFSYFVKLLEKSVPQFRELKFRAINLSYENKKMAANVLKKWLGEVAQFGLEYREGVLKSGQPERKQKRNNRRPKRKTVSRRGFAR